jgi:polysaccharide pyruvyl transferase WcaK-like protein
MGKKILLCGAIAAEKNNFGDYLMTDILKRNILMVDSNATFVLTNDGNENCKFNDYLKADCLIYVPGGYLGYIEKFYSGNFMKSRQRLFYYYLPGILAYFLRKPILFIGQGVGPYEYCWLAKILKFIFNHAAFITVRDDESKNFLTQIGVKRNVFVTSDTSQTLLNHNYIRNTLDTNRMSVIFKKTEKIIFILYTEFPIWKTKLLDALKKGLLQDENIGFVIGADNVVNMSELREFANNFPKDRTFIFQYRTHIQLLSILDKVDIVLTCKLHTGITGCTLSKSVICFALQYEKTKCYYKQIGESNRVRDLFSVSSEEMYHLILRYYDKSVNLPIEIKNKAELNFVYLKRILKKLS